MNVTKTNSLVLYRKITALAAYSGNHMESRGVMCGHNTEILMFNLVVNIVTNGL